MAKKRKTTNSQAFNTGDAWFNDFIKNEKQQQQKIEKSKALDAVGNKTPYADRVVIRYDNSSKEGKKFNESEGTLANKSSKWRTSTVEDLGKSYGKKYNDKLRTAMNQAGIPESERYEFAKWMDANEKGISNDKQGGRAPINITPKLDRYGQDNMVAPPVNRERKQEINERQTQASSRLVSKQNKDDRGVARKAFDEAMRFMNNVNNSATFGLGEVIDRGARNLMKDDSEIASQAEETLNTLYSNVGRGTAGRVADFVGEGVGMVTSGGQLAKALQAAGIGIKSGASLGQNALRMAGQGALAGGGDQAMRSIVNQTVGKDLEDNQNRTWGDEAKNIALATALGGVIDPALTVGPQAIRQALRSPVDSAVRGQLDDITSQLIGRPDIGQGSGVPQNRSQQILDQLVQGRQSPVSNPIDELVQPTPRANPIDELVQPQATVEPPAVDTKKVQQQIKRIDTQLKNDPTNMALRDQKMQLQAQLQRPQTNRDAQLPIESNLDASDSLPQNVKYDEDGNPYVDASEEEVLSSMARSVEGEKALGNNLPTASSLFNQNRPVVNASRSYSEPIVETNQSGALGARAGVNAPRVSTDGGYAEPLPSFMDNTVRTTADERSLVQKAKDSVDSVYASVADELQPVRRAEEAALRADTRGVIDYNKPTTMLQRLKGTNVLENVKAEDSLTKSMQVVGKGAHSRAAVKTEKVWSDFAKKIENDPDVPVQQMLDYAFARHGLKLLDDSDAGFISQADALAAANPNASEDDIIDMMLDYKNYQLPEGASREVLEETVNTYGQNPKLVQYYEEFQQLQAKKLDDMYESGLINKAAYDEMKKNDTYISMARNFHEEGPTGLGGSRQARTPIERMKSGSTERTKNAMQEAIRQTYVTEFNIQKNNALKPIVKYAQIPNSGFRKLLPNEDVRGLSTVDIYVKGTKTKFEVPEPVANYANNISLATDTDAITGSVQKLAELQRKLTTQYSPAFILKSALREPVQSIIVSRTNKGWIDGVRNLGLGYADAFFGPSLEKATSNLPKSLQFKSFRPKFEEFGGNQFQYMNMADKELKKSMQELMDTGTINGSKNMKVVSWYPRFLNYMGEKVEAAPRLGEFRSAKRRGYDDLDAFYEATDLTNFKRTGTFTGKANKVVPYLNATIQGNDRVLRAFKEAPAKTVARGVTGLSSIAGLAYMARFHDGVSEEQRNELRALQDYQRNANIFVPNFWDENSDEIYVIPKPFAVGQMFMNPVERVLDDYYNQLAKDPSVKDTAGAIMGDIARSFMPPTGVALVTPLFENMVNTDTFTGMPIEQDTDLPKGERETYGQSVLTKWTADLINYASFSDEGIVSPADVDNFVKSTIGSEGTRALQASDQYLSDTPPVGNTNNIERILGQFIHNPTTSGRGYNDLRKLSEAEDKSGAIKRITGDPEQNTLRHLNEEERAQFDGQTNYYNMFKDYEALQDEIKSIRESKTYSSEAKARLIGRLRQEQDALYGDTVDYFNRLNNQK